MSTDLDHSVFSAFSAPSPQFQSRDTRLIRESRLAPSLLLSSPPSEDSSPSTVGSPGQRTSPRSITLEPPPLPFLSSYRATEGSGSSSPDNRKAESSIYYTTAWGSPYAAPSTRRLSVTNSQLELSEIDNGSGPSSPVSSVANHTELRRSSIANDDILVPVDRDLVANIGDKSIRDFTQDWINQYLTGQPRTERSNWLSDDSGSEAPSFITARNHFADDASDDWLGLEDDFRSDDLLKTPTLSDFVGKKAAARAKGNKGQHKRADTLRQEDFWGFAYDKDPPQDNMSNSNTPTVEVNSPIDKPLPPPPADAMEDAAQMEDPFNPGPLKIHVPDISRAATPTPRRRKKLNWRGKACIIELPNDDRRGSEPGYRLLTPADVQQRMQEWEDEGYDVRGFTIGDSEDPSTMTTLGGLSRPLYPDPYDLHEISKSQPLVVNFPDRAKWEAYITELQEEKLRALGVSFGDDEPAQSISPDYSLNPSGTPFPGLVTSPPIPTASAASNPLGHIHPFSPHFNQSSMPTPGGMGTMASPSQFGMQTPFMGADQNMMGGFPFQFQPTPPAQGAMTPQGFINPRQPTSSAGPGAMGNFSSMLSPVSPLHDQGSFYPAFNDKGVFDAQFGHGMHQEGLPYQAPKTPVNGHPDNFHASSVEIAQPTPRGHGHNLSETLQRGLDQMTHTDYHLEDSIDRQLEDDYRDVNGHAGLNAGILKSGWGLPENENHPLPPHPFAQHQLPQQIYGDQYQQNGHDGSDLDTNPSVAGTPQTRQGPWHETQASGHSYHGGHQSQLSSSSLNVEAKAFNPNASFNPQPVPFGNDPFQFGRSQGLGFAPPPSFVPGSTVNVNGPMSSKLNHNASSSGGFKFSAASFNVDAPVFNPNSSIGLNSNASSEQPPASRTKIFGDIDTSKITTPEKKSKAIPIVRPDEIEQETNDKKQAVEDDTNGRPVPTDRHKRACRGVGNAEGEATYSSSTQPLGEAGNAQASSALHVVADGKENAIPKENNLVDRTGTPVSEADTWTLFDAKREAENGSQPGSPIRARTSKDIVIEEREPREPAAGDDRSVTVSKDVDHALHGSKSSTKTTMLSPSAQPFEFKPAVSKFVPTTVQPSSFAETKPVAANIVKEQPIENTLSSPVEMKHKQAGLMDSRFAVTGPSKNTTTSDHHAKPESNAPTHVEPDFITRKHKHYDSHWDSENDSPDDEELNAIMEQLNDDDADVGIERHATPYQTIHATPFQPRHDHLTESMGGPTKEKRFGSADARSEAPSPSPGGVPKTYKLTVPKHGSDMDANSNATFSPQKSLISRLQSPVRQLFTENDHVSDWDDMISAGEDEKFMNRNRFFDRRINDLVGSAIDDRLGPVERALAVIQQSVASIASGTASRMVFRSTSAEMEDSDADDEDDDGQEASVRDRSPHNTRERKLEMLKNVVMEALITHDIPQRISPHSSHHEMSQLKESIAELQALTIKKLAQDPVGDMREILEEAMAKQLAQQIALQKPPSPRLSEAEEIGADSLMLQIEGLKGMLRVADERAEQEYKDRRDAQDAMTEVQRLLKLAREDAARHSAAAEDAESRLLQFKEEKIPYFEKMQFRTESLMEESETLKVTIAELSTKNIALEGTLDEYRLSSDSFRRQLETTRGENKSLHETVDHLRTRIEDSMISRQNLTEKFDRLQDDMISVTAEITRDQAVWRRREEDHTARYNELRASHSRELKLREKLEEDVYEFEKKEREATKLRFVHEQSQQDKARLEELVTSLRAENHELQIKAARFEREFVEARESSRVEIQRTRSSMEADLEAANSQVNIVRAELEAQIIRLETQLDNNRMDTDTSRERYELLLEEARDSKATALAAKDLAIDETRKMHERILNDLRERHARALHNSSEDRARGESHNMERMALSEDKAKHLQERVNLLEEKVEIAQAAARAAAEAAHSAKAKPSSVAAAATSHSRATPSMSYNKGSEEPERISPQALRESIFVLQDQLQQRETRIEELEQEVSAIDKDAPNKIKEKDTEITWLRELLGVRIDDLQDIIDTVSKPAFNQQAVRDAAIRLKANLQMQQQEKERLASGNLPSLADLAASPRSLPLAAAAAWGNWRKGRESAANASNQTPSKPSNASTFLSGLLTPPSSHARGNGTGSQTSAAARFAQTRPLRSFNSAPKRGAVRSQVPAMEPPQTPPLLRRSSYDHDAEPANYEDGSFADENESTVDGMVSASPRERDNESPFGPTIDEAEAEESYIIQNEADADADVSSSDEPSTEEE
ncbi:hypothetical protein DTO027I6_6050 [Penicillium roqueforti]|uniref:uncharacterized protein n=1 Tax=Penicillium roqueforti TaxID=5082 RepID=UPI00190DC5F5|nr:uncharacterized protein LCP9604111_7825 [Penicillium roqueforti]KAF9243029.1 hypothetical protein LCP9604111_7825 [Penicillium roqueforti]KAI2680794.1 hypothetical protein CBS147355_3774 [Penicillium roqueforti]KAI2690816.1 hypothetical protein LCP963914a_1017 [Penicillium roqueforti]KAI2706123.1 hypothetical protein CBS147372_34 [Penicillium roqueforti]KAI3138308.1 hypothetical protein CBS147326_3046 [Penicillium roqueforti]